MRTGPFERGVHALRALCTRFDADAHAAKTLALKRLSATPLHAGAALPQYHDLLLFLLAHPSDADMRQQVERELRRIARHLRQLRGRHATRLEGQGLPYIDTVTRFSHDCLRWLLGHADCRVTLEAHAEPRLALNDVLRLTLPTLERNETTAGLSNDALLDALQVPGHSRLAFIVNELSRFDALPYVKDQLFDALDLFVRIRPRNLRFSKAYNRLPMQATHYQHERLRDFDAMALMNQRVPAPRRLDFDARTQAIGIIRNALVLTRRETDPATYLDAGSLRVFDLERGLTLAIYGMTADRQLPLESYVGFTLFKNGLPAAYGGAWLLGPRSNFGMNIFEPYRGGESGYMMCQVLRVYRQLFGITLFEVDAHQFGLDNPDGIATAAFWFYYRYGFRPLDVALAKLALRERQRMLRRADHRSSEQTLLRLTGSNLALNFGGAAPPQLVDLSARVTRWVRSRHGGDRVAAEADCVKRFHTLAKLPAGLSAAQRQVLVEVAFVAVALKLDDDRRIRVLRRMVTAKPADLYRYQALMLEFFAAPGSTSIRAPRSD